METKIFKNEDNALRFFKESVEDELVSFGTTTNGFFKITSMPDFFEIYDEENENEWFFEIILTKSNIDDE